MLFNNNDERNERYSGVHESFLEGEPKPGETEKASTSEKPNSGDPDYKIDQFRSRMASAVALLVLAMSLLISQYRISTLKDAYEDLWTRAQLAYKSLDHMTSTADLLSERLEERNEMVAVLNEQIEAQQREIRSLKLASEYYGYGDVTVDSNEVSDAGEFQPNMPTPVTPSSVSGDEPAGEFALSGNEVPKSTPAPATPKSKADTIPEKNPTANHMHNSYVPSAPSSTTQPTWGEPGDTTWESSNAEPTPITPGANYY